MPKMVHIQVDHVTVFVFSDDDKLGRERLLESSC